MEVAGLVLAIFPIVVNGLTGLAQAATTFDNLRKPSRELGRYGRSLKRELSIYRNTLTELLEGIVDSDDDLKAMIEDSDHDLWQESTLEQKLRTRLDQAYDIFLETLDEVLDEMQDLVHRLKLTDQDNNAETKSKSEKFIEHEIQRFKAAFNKTAYQELYDRIQKLNNYLRDTTQQSIKLESSRQKKTTAKHSLRLKKLRGHARNIHHSVTGSRHWRCDCRSRHQVTLRFRPMTGDRDLFPQLWKLGICLDPMVRQHCHLLELCPVEDESHQPESSSALAQMSGNAITPGRVKKTVKFDFAMCTDQKVSVVQMHLMQTSLGNVRITDLCSALESTTKGQPEIGFLEAEDSTWRCSVKYNRASNTKVDRTLQSILQENAQKGSASRVVFSRGDRLGAAATLAWSILFLDGSWLRPHWTSSDVLLLRDADRLVDQYGTQHGVDELAFSWIVCKPLIQDQEMEKKHKKLAVHRICGPLFALAMALIELSLGEPFSQLRTKDEDDEGYVSGNLSAAHRLLPIVECQSGFEYHEVVRRCLDCPFDVRDKSLDNEAFLALVFDDIVKPLIKDYQKFRGF